MKIPEKDDLISRKEAIDMLTRSSIYSLSTEDDQAAHSWAIGVLEMLPSKGKIMWTIKPRFEILSHISEGGAEELRMKELIDRVSHKSEEETK